MKRKLLHIWKYVASPQYRLYIDLMTSQELLNRRVKEMKDQIELWQMHPVIDTQISKYSIAYGISVLDAKKILKAQHNITL